MRRRFKAFLLVLILTALFGTSSSYAGGGHDHSHGHGEESHHETEPKKGPHGGKLLQHDDFALELTIFEKDVPPQFRLYPYSRGRPIAASEVTVKIELVRFGEKKEEFDFTSSNEYLTSPKVVAEPHSFDVNIDASWKGKDYAWKYQSHEGRTELSDEALKIANISVEVAGAQEISNVTNVYGRLLLNQDRLLHLRPRFPGVVKEIKKELGDKVSRGEILAIVESNQSFQPYEIGSPIAGVVIARHATIGESVSDDKEIFVVADLSEIWADFQVYRDDFGQIERGQLIKIDFGGKAPLEAIVKYVSPLTDEATQSKLVRAVIPNADGNLRPGLFVSGILASNTTTVPIAVRREAIQTFRDWKVVYLTDGHAFQAMPVELGRQDSNYVEILSGISQGDRYVARNSFIIKADVEKSGATHDH